MPELPDITVYIDALRERIVGRRLERIRILSPFVLRTAEPAVESLEGTRATEIERLGKRIAIGFDSGPWLVLHLMIAGRLHWTEGVSKKPTRQIAAAFEFETGTLSLTEAGTKKRASVHVARDRSALSAYDRGGLDVREHGLDAFVAAMTRENHTLKRALTDPSILSGIGNAYSDEILHRAGLSPVALTSRVSQEEWARLHAAVRDTLDEWTERLREQSKGRFPEKVTAFRPEMRVHGRYGKPCPVCGTAVQRIRFATNETNYCPRCQTGGRLLADRALSRLLKKDWPRSIDELEQRGH
ncbi:MAG TPA: DNA-formamidopyrimidine glycosylase family protein [Gammaproteobacteria bacterium]|nr:DNA-formamidopyrimidine glycosylase family protein [Gammaproteobacteria bacterium]